MEIKDKDAQFKAQYLNQILKASLCGALFSGISVISKEYDCIKDDMK
ncbi:hypothetical protein [Brachyspira hampsonii]|nr:hypothetical protein [Brachyspira hampsonii]